MKAREHSESAWLAIAYVCGELSAEEASAFEERLEHDQEAREALAEAVELAGAVAQLPPDLDRVLRPRGGRVVTRLPRWVLSAAAALVLALLGSGAFYLMNGRADSQRRGSSATALALAWSGVHRDEANNDELLDWLEVPGAPEGLEVAGHDGVEAADGDVPDWMVAAAALNGDEPERKEN